MAFGGLVHYRQEKASAVTARGPAEGLEADFSPVCRIGSDLLRAAVNAGREQVLNNVAIERLALCRCEAGSGLLTAGAQGRLSGFFFVQQETGLGHAESE